MRPAHAGELIALEKGAPANRPGSSVGIVGGAKVHKIDLVCRIWSRVELWSSAAGMGQTFLAAAASICSQSLCEHVCRNRKASKRRAQSGCVIVVALTALFAANSRLGDMKP